jgi:hypothetical protein
MKVKKCTFMSEIYSRAARWIGVIPRVIRLSGKLHLGGTKVANGDPNVLVLDKINLITVLKMDIQDSLLYSLNLINERDDMSQMKRIKVED